ncbi:hypothetical protein AX16_002800 [Volvariella volvacea WC 439]|nr:hypothetical protein AX16_002800 [Volvariella volvacea WC 439]
MQHSPSTSPPTTSLLHSRHLPSQTNIHYLDHPFLTHLSNTLAPFLSFLTMSLAYLLSWIYPTRISLIDSEPPPLILEDNKPIDPSTFSDDDSLNESGSPWETDLTSTPSSVDTAHSVLRKPSLFERPAVIPSSPGIAARVNSAPPRPLSTYVTATHRIRPSNSENGTEELEQRGVSRVAVISGNQSPIPGQIRDIFNGVEVSISLPALLQEQQEAGPFQWKVVALNFGRSAILKSKDGIQGIALIADLLRQQTIQDVVQLRNSLTAGSQPDIDKVHHISYFDRFMSLQSASELVPGEDNLKSILTKLQSESSGGVGLLVAQSCTTILACLRIPTSRGDVFATLNLRSTGALGGPVIFFNHSVKSAAARLHQLLPLEGGISADIFVTRDAKDRPADVHHALFEQSIVAFDLQKSLEQSKVQHENLRIEKQELEIKFEELRKAHEAQVSRIDALTAENGRLTAEVESCNQTRQQTVATLSTRIDFLENENRRLRTLAESAPKDGQPQPPAAAPAHAEPHRPAGKMKQSTSRTDNLVAENQRLQAEVKTLQNQLNTLTVENSRLVAKSKMRGSRITALVAENQRTQTELKTVRERLNRQLAAEGRAHQIEGALRHQPSQQPTIAEPSVVPAPLGDPRLHASVVSLGSVDDSDTVVDSSHPPSRAEEAHTNANTASTSSAEIRSPPPSAENGQTYPRSVGIKPRGGFMPSAFTDSSRRMVVRLRGPGRS